MSTPNQRLWARHNKAKRVNVCGAATTIRRRAARPAAEPYFTASNIIAVGIPAPRAAARYWPSYVRAIWRWKPRS